MTLKTLLKNAGVPKIRGLESAIQKHQFELYKWAFDELNVRADKNKELEKLNTELQEQHKKDLETIQKLEDQVKAADVKIKFTEAKREEYMDYWSKAESKLDDEQEMVKHLTERIEALDRTIVHMKQYKS